MSQVVELEIPARAEFLAVARLVVVAAASIEPSFTEERIDNLRLAVSEACANAINAQAKVGVDDQVKIRCDLTDDRIEVEVVDQGPGFDPDSLFVLPEPTDPARLEFEHGLGIPLMRTLTDETEITTSPAGTAVRLVVYSAPSLSPLME